MKKIYLTISILFLIISSLNAQFKFDIQGASSTYVVGVNDSSHVVGYCVLDGVTCGFYYNGVDTVVIRPARINGAVSVWLGGINNHELAAGHYSDGTNYRPFLFNTVNGNISFPYSYVAPLNTNYKVNGINDNNVISGDYVNGPDRKIWMEGPNLPMGSWQYNTGSGLNFKKFNSYGGYGITNDNKVIGWYIDGVIRNPFIYDQVTNKFELITKFNGGKTQAYGVNGLWALTIHDVMSGKGYKLFSSAADKFVYKNQIEIVMPGASKVFPSGINKKGHACGWYEDSDGQIHGFMEREYDLGYLPSKNGYMHNNTAEHWWPKSEWEHIDYSYDPYLGKGHGFPFNGSKSNLSNSTYPSWPLWLTTFGPENCYITGPLGNRYLIPSTYFHWEAMTGKYEGSCFGLSSNSITTWDTLEMIRQKFPHAEFNRNLANVLLSDEQRNAVNKVQTYQYGALMQAQIKSGKNELVEIAVSKLKSALADTNGLHPILGIYHGEKDNFFAHAMLPYKIQAEIKDGLNNFGDYLEFIYNYDPNTPIDDHTGLVIIPDDYGNTNWFYEGNKRQSNLVGSLRILLVNDLYKPGTPRQFFNQPNPSVNRALGEDMLTVAGEDAQFRIGSNGLYAGPWGDTVLQSLTTAVPFVPITGTVQRPRNYYISKDGVYSYELKRIETGTQSLYFFRDGLLQKFHRNDANKNDIDKLESNDVILSYNNDSGHERIINFTTVFDDTTTHESLTFIIDSLITTSGSVITTRPNTNRSFTISNSKNTGFYNLRINSLTNDALKFFAYDSIPFGIDESHTISFNPDNQPEKEVLILVDYENDGTIDDTLFIENQVGIELLLSKRMANYPAHSGYDTLAVENIGSGTLEWNIVQKPDWITILSGESGNGEGQIILSYPENNASARSGLLVIQTNKPSGESDTVLLVQEGPLSIGDKLTDGFPIELYPNPAGNQLYIGFSKNLVTPARLTVFDLAGKPVLNTSVTSQLHALDISTLSQGIYLMQVQSGDQLYQKSFLKR